MDRDLRILGNGQIWDLRGISPVNLEKTFEDLFSGRALGEMAQRTNQQRFRGKEVFSSFKEKGRITGFSVTKALLSNNKKAKNTARALLKDLAKNAALGIKALSKGRGCKAHWSAREKKCWKNPDIIIIGGGVSEGLTGKILVNAIQRYLSKNSLSRIEVYQAEFPGKEAGFLGGVISILKIISKEAKEKGLKAIAGISLDLGREEIGAGLLSIDPDSGKIILKKGKNLWLFQHSVKTPGQRHLKTFLDLRKDYTLKEQMSGKQLRRLILKQMVHLIIQAQKKAQKFRLVVSRNIAVAVPGCTSPEGYIINSTDYLPFFRKEDGFNFSKELEEFLAREGLGDYCIHIINDGIAAGIANAYLGLPKDKRGKFVFLGVGSGLGGCVGEIIR